MTYLLWHLLTMPWWVLSPHDQAYLFGHALQPVVFLIAGVGGRMAARWAVHAGHRL